MDFIDRYIFKNLNMLSRSLNEVARANHKAYKATLFMYGMIGAIVWIQDREIRLLRQRVNDLEEDIYDLECDLIVERKENNPEKVE